MQRIRLAPVPSHARRQPLASPDRTTDTRWVLLDIVRECRHRLSLRDRDIAVLRGLLSLLPANPNDAQRIVFASNRVLIERCDGIDERTLRRRIARLQDAGLILRRSSPNGKRYQLRDADNVAQLSFGLDLAPLFVKAPEFAALAEECRRDTRRAATLKALIRDALYHAPRDLCPALAEEARLSLRRGLSCERLELLLSRLATELTASDSQFDRHTESSDKDSLNLECAETMSAPPSAEEDDLSIHECMDLAPTARSMTEGAPQSWQDVIALSTRLAPAIGVSGSVLDRAKARLGPHGCALAVLGLVEAFGRIRNPEAYLSALAKKAETTRLDFVRMYRSLVRGRSMGFAG